MLPHYQHQISSISHRAFLLAWSILFLSGCLRTPLTLPPLEPAVVNLNALHFDSLYLEIETPAPEEIVGHQYLLVVFPFGRFQVENLKEGIEFRLREQFALNGQEARMLPSDSPDRNPTPLLSVTLESLSITAYDFLITRYLFGSLDARIRYQENTQSEEKSFQIQVSDGEFRKYGFQKEGEHLLKNIIHTFSENIISIIQGAQKNG